MQDAGLKGTDYVLRAFSFVFDDLGRIVRDAIAWSAPLVALGMWPVLQPDGFATKTQAALFELQATGNIYAGPTGLQWLFLLGGVLLQMALISGFAIQRHQHVLRTVMTIRRPVAQAVGPYIGYWLAMALGAMLIGMLAGIPLNVLAQSPIAWLFPLAQVALLIGIGLLVLRSSLVFPAISVGDPDMNVRTSMEMTSRSIWRMALAVILIALPLVLAELVLDNIISALGDVLDRSATELWGFSLASIFVTMLLQFIGAALFTAYLSLVYAHKRLGGAPTPPHWNQKAWPPQD